MRNIEVKLTKTILAVIILTIISAIVSGIYFRIWQSPQVSPLLRKSFIETRATDIYRKEWNRGVWDEKLGIGTDILAGYRKNTLSYKIPNDWVTRENTSKAKEHDNLRECSTINIHDPNDQISVVIRLICGSEKVDSSALPIDSMKYQIVGEERSLESGNYHAIIRYIKNESVLYARAYYDRTGTVKTLKTYIPGLYLEPKSQNSGNNNFLQGYDLTATFSSTVKDTEEYLTVVDDIYKSLILNVTDEVVPLSSISENK